MTEDEAKTKVCPRTLGRQPLYDAQVQGVHDGSPDFCIASACMAWRKTKDVYVRPNGHRSDRDLYSDGRWETEGFCGLAGRPG